MHDHEQPRMTTNDHARPNQTSVSGVGNEQCTSYEQFSCCTSPEGDGIECFVDKMVVIYNCNGKRYMWGPHANDRTLISIASFE